MTALVPWFGSKRSIARQIIRQFGPHRSYWEPFCGSLAVLLGKPACPTETVNDLHGDLVNLARVVRDPAAGAALAGCAARGWSRRSCAKRPSGGRAEGSRRRRWSQTSRAPMNFFVTSWAGVNGVAGTKSYNQGFSVRYTARGGGSGTRFRGAVDSIPSWRRRLRNVSILNRDAFEVLAKIADEPGTLVYCDPPYLEKGAEYVHDFTAPDHRRLSEMLARFRRARVVVSYYADPRLAELYPEWTAITVEANRVLVQQNRRDETGKITAAPEVLLINRPADQAQLLF